MARDNLFISLCGTLAPHTGFVQVVGFRKHSRELHRIIGIVGNGGEASKACDCAIALAEFIFNLGQMALDQGYDAVAIRKRLTEEPYREGVRVAWNATDLEGVFARYVGSTALAHAAAAGETLVLSG